MQKGARRFLKASKAPQCGRPKNRISDIAALRSNQGGYITFIVNIIRNKNVRNIIPKACFMQQHLLPFENEVAKPLCFTFDIRIISRIPTKVKLNYLYKARGRIMTFCLGFFMY